MNQPREHVRRMLQVSATVHVVPASHDAVHLIDISRFGVEFASVRPLESGSSFRISLRLPGAEKPCVAEGTIVYCIGPSPRSLYRLGARITMIAEETLEQLRDFITLPPVASDTSPEVIARKSATLLTERAPRLARTSSLGSRLPTIY